MTGSRNKQERTLRRTWTSSLDLGAKVTEQMSVTARVQLSGGSRVEHRTKGIGRADNFFAT